MHTPRRPMSKFCSLIKKCSSHFNTTGTRFPETTGPLTKKSAAEALKTLQIAAT
jgi:hypothetical protein